MPGRYKVSITIPGIPRALAAEVTVQADPMDKEFTAAARAGRQQALMNLYALQKRLASAHGEAMDNPRLRAELDRLTGVSSSLMRAIESFNSLPTTDQRQQMAWVNADADRALTMVRRTP